MQKKLVTLFLSFLCSLAAMAQSKNPGASISGRKVSNETLEKLKATTTVFFYSKLQGSEIDSIKQAVTDGWKLTPLIFDDISNFSKYYANYKYSYFTIEKYTTETRSATGSGLNYTNTHYFIGLHVYGGLNKKGNIGTIGYCRIELYPNAQTLFGENKAENLYNKGAFYNWSPVLLKAQLEAVSSHLENNLIPDDYYEFKDKELTKILSTDTLYVPKSVLMSFNAFTGHEKEKQENIFDGYRYNYRLCTDDELFDVFQVSKKGRLLFEYVKSSTDKFITIYDLQQKRVIYRNYVGISYNLKSKDISRIK
jgi:hypothetical protein